MNRMIPAALALACALFIAGCQTALVPQAGTITGGDLSGAAGTLPPATVSALEAKAAQVRRYALAACGVVPTLETIANIFAASNAGIATASNVASIVCKAVQGSSAYTAGSRKAAAAPAPAPASTVAAPVGSTVTGVAVVNGTPVRVTGKVVR